MYKITTDGIVNEQGLLVPQKQLVKDSAGVGTFLNYELLRIRSQLFQVKRPDLIARDIVPTTMLEGFPLQVREDMLDKHGGADFISQHANDLPTVAVSVGSTTYDVKPFGNKYTWSIIEEMGAASSSANPQLRSLVARRAETAFEDMARFFDDLIANGSSKVSFEGYVDHSAVNEEQVANDGTSSGRAWSTKTPDLIIRDIMDPVQDILANTKGTHRPNVALIPLTSWADLGTRRLGTASDISVLEYIQRRLAAMMPGFEIIPWQLLETAGTGSSKRMIVAERNPEVAEVLVAQEFTTVPPQASGLKWVVHNMMASTGVILRYPKAMEYRDSI